MKKYRNITSIAPLDYYRETHILITGVTGFLGKVLFAMLLKQYSNIQCVYLLIRPSKKYSAIERFNREILTSPVFISLIKEDHNFKNVILSRVKVIEGDICFPDLGLSNEVKQLLYEKLDMVFHAAGLVNFYPNLQEAINININGALNIAAFVKKSHHAHLLHFSTCYVSGQQKGIIDEAIDIGISPKGDILDEENELTLINGCIANIIKSSDSILIKKRKLYHLGRERALKWGWPNTYCYTKALAERLLSIRYGGLSMSILRPSIVESALSFPFSGWNEGLNGTAPLSMRVAKTNYRYVIGNKETVLDIVPVDLVCKAALLVAAKRFNNSSIKIYQIATSAINPCYLDTYVKITRLNYINDLKKNLSWFKRTSLSLSWPRHSIRPDSLRSPKKLLALLNQIKKIFNVCFHNNAIINSYSKKLNLTIRQLQSIELINQAYMPFTYQFHAKYSIDNIKVESFNLNQLAEEIKNINWQTYISEIHLPGLERWIFPLIQKQKSALDIIKSGCLSEREKILLTKIDSNFVDYKDYQVYL